MQSSNAKKGVRIRLVAWLSSKFSKYKANRHERSELAKHNPRDTSEANWRKQFSQVGWNWQ